MNFGSLFSGIGAFDLGLVRSGLELQWQCENDPYCRQILEKRFGVKIYKDVRTSKFTPVDVLAGGFPCQPVSHAGRKQFEEDERWLWPYFLEVIHEIKPRWILIENVDGLRTKGLGEILGGLAECGYDAEWDRIPAAAFGAPHLRYRFFIFAYPSSLRWNKGSYFKYFGEKEKRPRHEFRRLGCLFSYPHEQKIQKGNKKSQNEVFCGGWWKVEPDVGRMAYGTPYRVDRLKNLGNAVVVPAGYFMGKLVLFAEEKTREKVVA